MGYDEVKIGKGIGWVLVVDEVGIGAGFWIGFYLFSSY